MTMEDAIQRERKILKNVLNFCGMSGEGGILNFLCGWVSWIFSGTSHWENFKMSERKLFLSLDTIKNYIQLKQFMFECLYSRIEKETVCLV